MTILKTILIDDEPLSIDYLGSIIEKIPQLKCMAVCANGFEAIKAIQQYRPDIIFLDIQMPGLNGFEVVKEIQADVMPLVVFATAYDQYAIEAFDHNAVDYILKPFDPDRVKLAVDRALARYHADLVANRKPNILQAIESLESQQSLSELSQDGATKDERKLSIRDNGVVDLVPYVDIDWVDAAGDYMCIHAKGKTYVMRCTMKELEDKLDGGTFARIHRSTLVNLTKIESISTLPKGECQLHLNGDTLLKVSRNYRAVIQHLLN